MAGDSGLMRVIYIYTFTLSLSVSPRVCICACMHVQTQASQAYLHKSISEQAGTGRWVVRKCLCSYFFCVALFAGHGGLSQWLRGTRAVQTRGRRDS